MKPVDVKQSIYLDFNKAINDKDPKFKVDDNVRVPKYKSIFAKGYAPIWSEEVFIIKKVKNTVPWTHIISDFKGKEIVGTFYEKKSQKTNQKEFRVENLIKRKGDKLSVKGEAYDSIFNSCIDKKDMV